MTRLNIKRLESGGVITNYSCVSRCGHCLYNCGPHRTKDYLDGQKAETIFERIRSLGCRSVHIGGGEPLLDPPKLTTVLEAARRVGVGIEYVETNSAWFTDPDQADGVLTRLLDAGVHTLLVSISPFHNATIPFARVRGVIAACRRTGMQVFPWVNAFVRDLDRLGDRKPHSMAEFESAFGKDYLERIPDRYWIHLGGRALETFRKVYRTYPAARILEQAPLSCARALSDTSHFHIDLYGHYVPGLCAGLAIDMPDLGHPLPEGQYPLLDKLATTGIRGLHEWVARDFGYTPHHGGYLNHCDLCTDIRRYLFNRDIERFAELAPGGFYTASDQA
jgi:hypothetical protein